MNKDVIYIDVDDDITAIIGKIKESKEKIIALVPPKHVGVLQSAINLRLLDRMAKADKKSMVLVTNNQALIALSASARIPVAKNLQSKPEIAEIPALMVDDGDDIIDGADLPVGDHASSVAKEETTAKKAKAIPVHNARPTREDALSTLEIDGEAIEDAAPAAIAAVAKKTGKEKAGVKIPNFNKFRKRLFIGIAAGLVLIATLVWAYVFAPAATVIVTTDTTAEQVSANVKLGGSAATDYKTGVISSLSQEMKKDLTTQFTATGKSKAGTKATGSVVFKNCETSAAQTIPAGTTITSNDLTFTTDAAVTVPGLTISGTCTPGTSGGVTVTATAVGSAFNVASGTNFAVAGHNGPNATFYFRATATATFAGGESHDVTVVSDDDIQRAIGQLTGQSNDAVKKQLTALFKNGEYVIDSSFTGAQGTPVSAPASGAEVAADAKATLTIPMTYTIQAFSKSAVDQYLNASLNAQLKKNQRIYENGDKKVGFSNYKKADDGSMTVSLTATGQIGPDLDEAALKDSIKGMVTGTVQTTLQAIDGVQDVSVRYSYFWVNKIPNDSNKITLEFKLQ